jgi:hypothetical protein
LILASPFLRQPSFWHSHGFSLSPFLERTTEHVWEAQLRFRLAVERVCAIDMIDQYVKSAAISRDLLQV